MQAFIHYNKPKVSKLPLFFNAQADRTWRESTTASSTRKSVSTIEGHHVYKAICTPTSGKKCQYNPRTTTNTMNTPLP